jgi:hypothetical protein
LENALLDEDPLVRIAAERALAALEAPRILLEDFADLRLFVWRQVRHLWKPLGAATTNQRGEVCFTHLALDGAYRLQLLDSQWRTPDNVVEERSLLLPATHRLADEPFPEAMAASDAEEDFPLVSQSQDVTLTDGSLLCTLYRDDS